MNPRRRRHAKRRARYRKLDQLNPMAMRVDGRWVRIGWLNLMRGAAVGKMISCWKDGAK